MENIVTEKDKKTVLVVDKRDTIAGNIYTEKTEGINVHKYGAHIFHTNNKAVWEYVQQFASFNYRVAYITEILYTFAS